MMKHGLSRFRNAWSRFFLWVAQWFGPVQLDPPRPRYDKEAQELIDLCAFIREQTNKTAEPSWRCITPFEHQEIIDDQSRPEAVAAPSVYRSATLSVCNERLAADLKAKSNVAKKPLSLKVSR
jgi:hypothetical protein